MTKEKFLELLNNAKEDENGNLYYKEKGYDWKIYFGTIATVCDDLVDKFCGADDDDENHYELHDRHFTRSDDTLVAKIVGTGKHKRLDDFAQMKADVIGTLIKRGHTDNTDSFDYIDDDMIKYAVVNHFTAEAVADAIVAGW